jgi:hypothetical protein
MTRAVNSKRAVAECLDSALGESSDRPAGLTILHASLDHDLAELAAEALRPAPGSQVMGASYCGVVGSEGVRESMKALGVMSVRGESGEWAVAALDDVHGENAVAAAAQMAQEVKRQAPGVKMVFLIASWIDFAADRLIQGIESELGYGKPVAVLRADCLARGRYLFNRVLKEEIVGLVQSSLFTRGDVLRLDMYGFGEFARLGGTNEVHKCTTSLAVIARR